MQKTKKKCKKQKQKATQTKTKQNENIQKANEEYITHAKWNIVRNFSSDSKIQLVIQWDKFTPLSATKEQLPYQHWKSEKISYTFISSVDLDSPFSQYSPSNPGGHKHRYPLSVNPDWQVALFSQWGLLSQAF